jgi:pimeloyl-ACP methyl ester carboxylesterase
LIERCELAIEPRDARAYGRLHTSTDGSTRAALRGRNRERLSDRDPLRGSRQRAARGADLNALLEHLDLHDVVLVGFSMGSGEVTRYMGRYGSGRVRKAALLGAIPPFLLKRDDNPEGVDGEVFEDMKATIVKDRYAFFKDFLDNFYNVDVLAPDGISEQAWLASFQVAAAASPHATYVSSTPGSPTSATISLRSTCPHSSSTARTTGSCRSPRRPTSCPT